MTQTFETPTLSTTGAATTTTTATTTLPMTTTAGTYVRSNQLADRLEAGALALMHLALTLSDEEWTMKMPGDGRTVGVIVHHVGFVYPVEIQLAQTLAKGQPVTGVTMADVHAMNAKHAIDFAAVTKAEAVGLVRDNAAAAAQAIRALSDEQLANAAPASLYADAPVTCQFMLEDHAVRHSYHHLARLKTLLER
mgnify:CR=1 FL=1